MEHEYSLHKPLEDGETAQPAGVRSGLLERLELIQLRFLLDKALSIVWAGAAFRRLTGAREGEAPAFQTLRQCFAGFQEDFELLKGGLRRAFALGAPETELTVSLPCGSGGVVRLRLAVSFTKRDEGAPPVCEALGREAVGPQGEEQCALEHRAGYFRWMLDVYPGNVYISDMETYELLYLNPVACETLGLRPDQVVGRMCYNVIQGRSAPCPFCTNGRLTEDRFYEWEFDNPALERTFLIKDRAVRWQGRRARLELSSDNSSLEYNLAKKDREREAIIRTIPGGFARVDARDMRTILWYGGGFLSMIGYTQEQFETELHSRCDYVHAQDIERVIGVMCRSRDAGGDTVVEGRIITRDGVTKILTMTFSYVRGEDSWDGIPSFYSVGLDVTQERAEQERQRKALEDAYQMARVASSAKTDFLSSMSHDIRTPMNAVMGMTTIARQNLHSPEKMRDCLNKIDTSSRHLLSLINEVLDMSKIESGRIDLTPERVHLSDLIQSVMDICRPLAAGKQQQFQVHIEQLQHEFVVADGDRLQQVLMNLLSNAIKYTPEGGSVALHINELHSAYPHKSRFEFICTDTGIGIDEAFLPRLFEPFSRAEDPRISKLQGTGLGMTITDNIVRMMDGTIDVKSKPGAGTTFTVSLPLELCPEEETAGKRLAGLPVLVVDNDRVTCENAAALLGELGMKGDWVLSGEEAVRRVEEAHREGAGYYALIIDWQMPRMDGLETARTIRRRLGDEVPIVILSSYDYSDIEEEFLRAGADAFITKPLFKSKMQQVLELFLAPDRAREALPRAAEPSVLQGKRILLVEDNEMNREIAVELLGMQRLQVEAVENGERAVEVFAASAPGAYDAVLMDIQMPVMNGYEATAAIRALDREDARTIPILALTANAFAADVAKARAAGMNDHISKPIEVERLTEVLRRWLG